MSHFIAPSASSPVRTFVARARGLVRLAALAAVLAVAIQPSATNAAESGTDTDRAGVTRMLAVIDCSGNASGHGFDIDDGEDRFDEGDDEFVARPKPTDARPGPTDGRPPATSAAAPIDFSNPAVLAAVIGIGAGGLWLLRQARS